MLIRLLIIAALATGLYKFFTKPSAPDFSAVAGALPSVEFKDKLSIAHDPLQGSARGAPSLRLGPYVVTPVASFQVAGRVLGAEHYSADREARLAPVDLAMGWGRMADPAVLDSIDISQSGRFYFWHVDEFPIPADEIAQHSANMHLIPLNPEIASRMLAVKRGQQVRFKGYLVNVVADDGWHWQSSTSRRDRGAHACEVVLVDTLESL